jgi:hypothetical protein
MRLQIRSLACLAIGLSICGLRASGEEPAGAPIKKPILPGEAVLVQDRAAFALLPPEKERRTPQPWILYAPTLPGYPTSTKSGCTSSFWQLEWR